MKLNEVGITMFVKNQIDKHPNLRMLKLEFDDAYLPYPAIEIRIQKTNTDKVAAVYFYPSETNAVSLDTELKGNNCVMINFCALVNNELIDQTTVSLHCANQHNQDTDVRRYMPTNFHIVDMPVITIGQTFDMLLSFIDSADIMFLDQIRSSQVDFLNQYEWLLPDCTK